VLETTYSFNLDYFTDFKSIVSNDQPLYGDRFIEKLGPPRLPGEAVEERHIDIAFSIQKYLERCILALVNNLHEKTGLRKLCIAGGVGLNCSANSVIQNISYIDELFVQPAASDRGLPLGSALMGQIEREGACVVPEHLFLGPSYKEEDYERALKGVGIAFEKVPDPEQYAAELISTGKIIGWYQGRSEYGPRALGNRSILADPRSLEMKDLINKRIKFREEFRPFAPAVLEEEAPEIFEMSGAAPYMTSTFRVREKWRDKLPAVTHIDQTARVQTVSYTQNPGFFRLIQNFANLTAVPVVLNTSFNARGEPIVETPANALATFFSVGLDALFMGSYVVTKSTMPK
jgi:carbamoyltransferase